MSKTQNGIVRTIVRRFLILLAVSVMILAGFYVSLVVSARSVSYQDRKTVEGAIEVLRERGFNDEVFLLEHIAIYRSSDNWLNATVAKENAYAATNFPFEILTIYPDFFAYPVDDTERAAILLHEAKHLDEEGDDEGGNDTAKNGFGGQQPEIGRLRDRVRQSLNRIGLDAHAVRVRARHAMPLGKSFPSTPQRRLDVAPNHRDLNRLATVCRESTIR